MEALTKFLGVLLCVLCTNVFAATNTSVQLDTTIPPADGLLTADQIPPYMLPKEAAPAANPAAAPAPVAAPAPAAAPAAAH